MSFFASLSRFLGLSGGADPAAETRRLRLRVETLERQVEALAKAGQVDLSRLAPPPLVSGGVMDLVREGKTMHAIKLHREETGLGLREAKNNVDEAARRL
ncbi:MAG: hypothetical protein Q4G43_04125 [Mobilicoccus sp.]|nr:hypothetical protein [Mobilicoccus sp.]